MRLKLIDRIVLVLLLFVLLLLALGAIGFGLLLVPQAEVVLLLENVYSYWVNSVIFIGAGLLIVLLILRLLYVACCPGKRKAASVSIRCGEDGSVNVTMPTLSDIIQRTVAGIQGVVACKDTVLPKEGSMDIMLKVTLAEDTPIPEKTAELQTQLKESVFRLTGLTVDQVHVLVDHKPGSKNDVQ